MAVAHNSGNPRHRSQLFRSALRIATRHHNSRIWISPVSAANERSRGTVRLCGHAARIHHHNIRCCGIAVSQPRSAQVAAYRLAIGARRSASEMFNVKLRHISSVLPCRICRINIGILRLTALPDILKINHLHL